MEVEGESVAHILLGGLMRVLIYGEGSMRLDLYPDPHFSQ